MITRPNPLWLTCCDRVRLSSSLDSAFDLLELLPCLQMRRDERHVACARHSIRGQQRWPAGTSPPRRLSPSPRTAGAPEIDPSRGRFHLKRAISSEFDQNESICMIGVTDPCRCCCWRCCRRGRVQNATLGSPGPPSIGREEDRGKHTPFI